MPHHSTLVVLHCIFMHQSSAVLFCLLKQKQCHMRSQKFFNHSMISTNIRKLNTSSSQIKALQKLLEMQVWGNPYKASIVLLHLSLSLLLLLSNIMFSLDFSMFWQHPRKFLKHRWMHVSKMHCNVCLHVKIQLAQVF